MRIHWVSRQKGCKKNYERSQVTCNSWPLNSLFINICIQIMWDFKRFNITIKDGWYGTWMKYDSVFKFLERQCMSSSLNVAYWTVKLLIIYVCTAFVIKNT